MRSPPSLHIELRPSRLAAAFVASAYLASAALLALLPGPILVRAVAIAAIGLHGIRTLRSWAQRTLGASIVRIELSPEGRAAIVERRGRRLEGKVLPGSYVGTWFTALVVRLDGARWSRGVAILPDMLCADDLRRLRVMLRIVATPAAAPATPPLRSRRRFRASAVRK